MQHPNYEADEARFNADAYAVSGHPGIAWYVRGWETEPTEDTEWDGIEQRTGRVVCTMVGDDHRWVFDESRLIPLSRREYCGVCGQIGCGHDGYAREEAL